jgi:cyclopropane-fatty-acyl-phospholipid synthase
MSTKKDARQLEAAKGLASELATKLNLNASLRLWDGSVVPLGRNVTSELLVIIKAPGVISSLLRHPSLDRVIRHYAHGHIDFSGGTLIDIGEQLAFKKSRGRLKKIGKREIFEFVKPFLFAPALKPEASRGYVGDEMGAPRSRTKDDDKAFIQFHYDLSNEFYELFLDERMVYTCAYFTDWSNSLDQAQHDKLDMICRKLRLNEDERFLDIGCGWGGLVCHAAKHYGVKAHGVTLSQEQFDYAQARRILRPLTACSLTRACSSTMPFRERLRRKSVNSAPERSNGRCSNISSPAANWMISAIPSRQWSSMALR